MRWGNDPKTSTTNEIAVYSCNGTFTIDTFYSVDNLIYRSIYVIALLCIRHVQLTKDKVVTY